MDKQRFQKLAGLLNEYISRDEATRDLPSVQTIVDGKRGVAFVTERGNDRKEWEAIQKLIKDNGLKAMHVKGNEHNAFIVYAQGHEKDATELKDIAEKYGGYLAYNATEEDSRRIGQLLDYEPQEIEDYINKNYPKQVDEIVVKSTLDKNRFNRYIVKSGNHFYIDAFDIDTGEEVVKPGEVIKFKYGTKWYTGTIVDETHDDFYKIELIDTNELDEIVVKSTDPVSWEAFKKACIKELSKYISINDKQDLYDPGGMGMPGEYIDEFANGYKLVDWYIDECIQYYEDSIEDMLGEFGSDDVRDLAEKSIFYGGMNEEDLILSINDQDVYYIIGASENEDDEDDDEDLDEIVVKPTEKPGGVYIDGKKVNISSIDVDGIDPSDYPDYVDAYASYAEFEDGEELNEDQLEKLNSDYYDVVYDTIWDMLHEIVVKSSRGPKYKVGEVVKVKGIYEKNVFVISQVYESGNDCYTHKPMTMYLVGYNTIKKGKIDYSSRIPPEIMDQYWYSLETIQNYNEKLGEFTVPEEYLQKVPGTSDNSGGLELSEIVVKPSSANTWEGFKKLCVQRMAQFINLRDEYSIFEIGSMGNQDMVGHSDGYGALNHYITACQEEYESVDELIQYFEDLNTKEYTAKSLVNDLIYITGLNDFLQLDLNEHEALWLKPRLDEIVVKSSKKDPDYWESEDDLPKDIKIDWDWDDADYDSDLDEFDNEVYFGIIRGTDQYGDMYEAEWSSGNDDDTTNAVMYSIKRVGNINDDTLEEIIVKSSKKDPDYWESEDDLPKDIKIDWDWDDVYYESEENEEGDEVYFGGVHGTDQYGDMYDAEFSCRVDDFENHAWIYSIRRVGNINDDTLEEIIVKPVAGVTSWNYEKDLPESIKITWDYDTMTIDDVYTPSNEAEGWIEGYDQNNNHYLGIWYGWVEEDDPREILGISYIGNITKSTNESINEIVVKPTKKPIRHNNIYVLPIEEFPDGRMSWSEIEAYLQKLGSGWRLPTVKEIESLADAKLIPEDYEWYWTSEPYVFENNRVSKTANKIVLASSSDHRGDVTISAGFKRDNSYPMFPVKDVSSREEDSNKLAELLNMDEIVVKPAGGLETIVFDIVDSRGWVSFDMIELEKGVKAREEALLWYESKVSDIEDEYYEEYGEEPSEKELKDACEFIDVMKIADGFYYVSTGEESYMWIIDSTSEVFDLALECYELHKKGASSEKITNTEVFNKLSDYEATRFGTIDMD